MAKKALITGISGQDGSYLAELLLRKGYEVHGIVRRSSSFNRGRIDHLTSDEHPYSKSLKLHYGDLNDSSSLIQILQKVRPNEIYNLAAQSHVKISFEIPEFTAEVGALGTLRILEATRDVSPDMRFYQASTSELFGVPVQIPQNEQTPFIPRSPYGAAKLYAYWLCNIYRQAYGLFVSNGILFNHESPRRGENFITRKVTLGVAKIKHGIEDELTIGNLYATRDWGYAPDYVYGMWKMLQVDQPDDYVLATGEGHTVKDLVERTFALADYNLVWEGSGEKEIARDQKSGKILVKIDPSYYRPLEVEHLVGDASKAKKHLGWEPKTRFNTLLELMYKSDLALLANEKSPNIDQPLWPD
jgi:GDPmannose 4,6-dehydratase